MRLFHDFVIKISSKVRSIIHQIQTNTIWIISEEMIFSLIALATIRTFEVK